MKVYACQAAILYKEKTGVLTCVSVCHGSEVTIVTVGVLIGADFSNRELSILDHYRLALLIISSLRRP